MNQEGQDFKMNRIFLFVILFIYKQRTNEARYNVCFIARNNISLTDRGRGDASKKITTLPRIMLHPAMPRHFLLLVFFATLWCLPVSAQNVPDSTTITVFPDTTLKALREDDTPVNARHFSEPALEAYRQDKAYQYDREVKPANLNLFDEIIRWIFKNFFRRLYGAGESSEQTNTIFRLVCIALVVFAVIRLTKADWLGVLLRKGKKTAPPGFEDITENIHELNFDKLIAEATQAHNYTRATRLLYLKTLKTLTDKSLIDWQPHKTNYDYLRELSPRPYQPDFQHLSLLFEYICYGDFKVEIPQYREVEAAFKAFEQKI